MDCGSLPCKSKSSTECRRKRVRCCLAHGKTWWKWGVLGSLLDGTTARCCPGFKIFATRMTSSRVQIFQTVAEPNTLDSWFQFPHVNRFFFLIIPHFFREMDALYWLIKLVTRAATPSGRAKSQTCLPISMEVQLFAKLWVSKFDILLSWTETIDWNFCVIAWIFFFRNGKSFNNFSPRALWLNLKIQRLVRHKAWRVKTNLAFADEKLHGSLFTLTRDENGIDNIWPFDDWLNIAYINRHPIWFISESESVKNKRGRKWNE